MSWRFEANIDNITSLMIESIDDDRIELKGRVEDALKVLMRQMLVQKNGSIYVFLTDEEQEVNNENLEKGRIVGDPPRGSIPPKGFRR